VKNLAFATSSERFAQAFRHLPGFAFARLQTKPDPKRPDARLSMGYGFVGFSSIEAARKALKGMHGYVLDGHTLSVKFAGRGAEEQEEKKGGREKTKTTKMLVKNVPFEATRKDIHGLFRCVVLLSCRARVELLISSCQRPWPAQIRPFAEAFRPSLARLCFP
jgi:multiple RNA-binding domain-containing protein 1